VVHWRILCRAKKKRVTYGTRVITTIPLEKGNEIIFNRCKMNGTYLLTPWCRVLLEKLTGLQLVKKFPALK